MNDRKYLIIPKTELNKVNFNDVMEDSSDTLSYSADGKSTFIKWRGENPSFVSSIKNAKGPYTHTEILEIIRSDDWTTLTTKTKKKVT